MAASKIEVRTKISALEAEATTYFEECYIAVQEKSDQGWYATNSTYFWNDVPEPLKTKAGELRGETIAMTQEALALCRRSPLINDADVSEIKLVVKRLLALLRLRRYTYQPTEVLHDEGTVLGVQQGSQGEKDPVTPQDALRSFRASIDQLSGIIDLTEDASNTNKNEQDGSELSAYRQNTAFVMMWMDPSKPELEDVRDAVVETFRNFRITAVRADDIEHEGVITQRVITEIRTSEFLFADLSGSRPNVYYEVGYAHALGKRVILFRRKGTGMHFDLVGYNCPEYDNIRDLKGKLTKRIEVITNRSAERDATQTRNG